MHLLHPLTSFKIKTSAFQNVLDSLKFRVYEWSKEYVLQYNPKDHAACELLEYDYERKLAFKKVAFKSLSPDCEDFELLLEPFLGRLVLFKSTDMQWTTRNVPIYRDYYVIPFRGRFLTVTASSDMVNISYPCKIFLIDLKDGGLVRVEIYYSSSVGQFDCLKPDGELVSFQIYMMNDDQQNWTIVGSLGDVVLFLGTNCTFPCTASYLPPNCKGNCIVFCEPRWESTYVRGHDIYVADLQTRQIHPLKNSPGYSDLFRPPHDPLTWTRYQSWKKVLSFALRRFLASELLL
ncbi:F-box protein SKIP23-like [Fagus crenata]